MEPVSDTLLSSTDITVDEMAEVIEEAIHRATAPLLARIAILENICTKTERPE